MALMFDPRLSASVLPTENLTIENTCNIFVHPDIWSTMKLTVIIAIILFAFSAGSNAQDLSGVDFRLQDVQGKERSFQELLKEKHEIGKGVIVISFWALWCEPCKQELKAMLPVYEKFKGKNLTYIAISVDNIRSSAKVINYVKAQGLPYDFWLDPSSEVFKKLNGTGMPYSLIIDTNGKLIAKHQGFFAGDEKKVEEEITKAME
jgi:peroxiredoxin